MRRREKFIITSLLLAGLLLLIQALPLEWRLWASLGFVLLTYFASAWALYDHLNGTEWLSVVPMPALFAGSVAMVYTLLPGSVLSKIAVFLIFAIGIYALLLTANIYSVAKGRSIQLLHAAHAVGFWFMMLASLLYTNVIYAYRLHPLIIGLGVALLHFPLIFVSLWSIQLKERVSQEVVLYSVMFALLIGEFALILSLLPLSVWYSALFIMSLMYLTVSYVRSVLLGRLFARTFAEYALAAAFVIGFFLFVFPWK